MDGVTPAGVTAGPVVPAPLSQGEGGTGSAAGTGASAGAVPLRPLRLFASSTTAPPVAAARHRDSLSEGCRKPRAPTRRASPAVMLPHSIDSPPLCRTMTGGFSQEG